MFAVCLRYWLALVAVLDVVHGCILQIVGCFLVLLGDTGCLRHGYSASLGVVVGC